MFHTTREAPSSAARTPTPGERAVRRQRSLVCESPEVAAVLSSMLQQSSYRLGSVPQHRMSFGVGPTSERDSGSQQAQDDLDELLDVWLPFAQQMLENHGEFFPHAVAIATSGETELIPGDSGRAEQPTSADVLHLLVERLRASRDTLRTAAVVAPVRRRVRRAGGWPRRSPGRDLAGSIRDGAQEDTFRQGSWIGMSVLAAARLQQTRLCGLDVVAGEWPGWACQVEWQRLRVLDSRGATPGWGVGLW